jgi:hypothetical protein
MSTKPHKPEPSEWLRGAGSAFIFSTVRREIESPSWEGAQIGRKNEDPTCLADVDKTPLLRVATLRWRDKQFKPSRTGTSARPKGPAKPAGRDERPGPALLDDLEDDLETNDRAVTRKTLLFKHALTFLAFAILVELAGQVVQ